MSSLRRSSLKLKWGNYFILYFYLIPQNMVKALHSDNDEMSKTWPLVMNNKKRRVKSTLLQNHRDKALFKKNKKAYFQDPYS